MDESRISDRAPGSVDMSALCRRLLAREATVAVIGLGYVGLPLAVALARHFRVAGFDIDPARVQELQTGHDRTAEVDTASLRDTNLRVTADDAALAGAEVFIITVPTPVDVDNKPDLDAVRAACATVGQRLKPGAIVVLESTVYPGVVETVCGPELEQASRLACGRDFFLGYSPERANPGDREHTVDRIVKVVVGQTPEVTEVLATLYGTVTHGGVFRARSIKVAEAAKAIENAQRDINIAFVNEISMICGRLINDGMADFIAASVTERLKRAGNAKPRVLVLGLTFKENVPDLRNSKVADLVAGLRKRGAAVDVCDPFADAREAQELYGITLAASLEALAGYDCLVGAVPHRPYACLETSVFARLVNPGGFVADIKGMWRKKQMPAGVTHWQL